MKYDVAAFRTLAKFDAGNIIASADQTSGMKKALLCAVDEAERLREELHRVESMLCPWCGYRLRARRRVLDPSIPPSTILGELPFLPGEEAAIRVQLGMPAKKADSHSSKTGTVEEPAS